MNAFQRQLSKFRRKQQILAIMIFALVTAIIWIAGSLISSQRTTGISTELLKLSRPLNPNIRMDVIEELEGKTFYSSAELSNFTIFKIIKSRDGRTQRVVTLDAQSDLLDQLILQLQQEESSISLPVQEGSGETSATPSGNINNDQNPSSGLESPPPASLGDDSI